MTCNNACTLPVYFKLNRAMLLIDSWNSRLKILEYDRLDEGLLTRASGLARNLNLGKIIAYVTESEAGLLCRAGYRIEGTIAGFLKGKTVLCCSLFIDPERQQNSLMEEENRILQELRQPRFLSSTGVHIRKADERDLNQMIELFASAFETYPCPITDPHFLRQQMMTQRGLYHLAEMDGRISGIASAEIDTQYMNAEITDCVTRPECRGHGITGLLIANLEKELKERGIMCSYSLARAIHYPINGAFKSQGFEYSGRMVKNCQICGSYEDMNIWVKLLQ